MCGRFALDVHGDSVFSSFDWLDRARSDAQLQTSWQPKRNIAPTDQALVIGARPGAIPTARKMSWGIDGGPQVKRKHINARVETLETRSVFQRAYRRGRCLVPASGYYEWFDAGEGKKPYYAQDAGGQLLLMAGLYERNFEGVFGFVVVTQPSAGTAARYHDRMPLLVPRESRMRWLEDREPRSQLRASTPALRWNQKDPQAK